MTTADSVKSSLIFIFYFEGYIHLDLCQWKVDARFGEIPDDPKVKCIDIRS